MFESLFQRIEAGLIDDDQAALAADVQRVGNAPTRSSSGFTPQGGGAASSAGHGGAASSAPHGGAAEARIAGGQGGALGGAAAGGQARSRHGQPQGEARRDVPAGPRCRTPDVGRLISGRPTPASTFALARRRQIAIAKLPLQSSSASRRARRMMLE